MSNQTGGPPAPWIRYLAYLSLIGLLFHSDPRFTLFYAFGSFSVWGHPNRWLRVLSYLGFLGFLGIVAVAFGR
jgi:Trk-type K+ transport system membrane component